MIYWEWERGTKDDSKISGLKGGGAVNWEGEVQENQGGEKIPEA